MATTGPRTTKIPAPLYAAAGAGDLAYQQLRRLPAVVDQLRAKATTGSTELRERANTRAGSLRTRTISLGERDVERLRAAARRNAAVVAAGAQAAQERALAAYAALVARGERVVGTGVVQAADTVNADMEVTEAPPSVTATPADVAETVATADAPTTETAVPPAAKTTRATRTARKTTPAAPSQTAADDER